MTLQQIGQYLYSLLIQVAGLVAPLAEVLRLEKISAKEKVPYFISNEVTTIAENVVALQAAVATLSATLDLDNTAILLAISEVQQAGSPVTLPTVPPSGYAPPSPTDIASGVWSQPAALPFGSYTLDALTQSAWDTYQIVRGSPQILPTTPFFRNLGPVDFDYYGGTNTDPNVTLDTILSTDTVQTWLLREAPAFDWTTTAPWGGLAWAPDPINPVTWICTLDQGQFAQIQAALHPAVRVPQAPVWPGLAGVTLLTPVALDIGVTIAEACSGAIIDITAVPSKQGQFALGDMTSWRNVGAIAFVDDNGEAEYPQTLGLVHGVYLAKSMAVAAGLVLRASPGVTGTVTPFTIP